uniref:Uncharacterized protein n=1 Tax=Rhizophora mucronata TaxID=61149 RepID=A0A2P2J4Z1_RHIMU
MKKILSFKHESDPSSDFTAWKPRNGATFFWVFVITYSEIYFVYAICFFCITENLKKYSFVIFLNKSHWRCKLQVLLFPLTCHF